jgi:hypothetical protein
MGDLEFKDVYTSGSIFWLSLIAFSVFSFIYLGIKSVTVTNSILGVGVAVLFLSIIFFSMIFVGSSVLQNEKDITHSVLGFFAGFGLMAFIINFKNIFQFSILNVFSVNSKQGLMALLSTQLTPAEDFRLNVINVPVAEELLWLITIPILVIFIMNITAKAKRLEFFENKWFQLLMVCLVSGLSFAFFHVGQLTGGYDKYVVGFLVSAFVFRTVLLLLYVGDGEDNIIKWADVTASFALGIHIANNWLYEGFIKGFQLLTQDFWGILFLTMLGIYTLIAVIGIVRWVRDR